MNDKLEILVDADSNEDNNAHINEHSNSRNDMKNDEQPKLSMDQVDQLFDAGIFKLLAEPIRIHILKILVAYGAQDITAIASHFKQDRSVISKHLKMLHKEGVLMREKQSRSTIYSVDGMAFLHKMEHLVDDVKVMSHFCCTDLYQELYDRKMTYQEYLSQEKVNKQEINKQEINKQ